jgi:hypothetical protein
VYAAAIERVPSLSLSPPASGDDAPGWNGLHFAPKPEHVLLAEDHRGALDELAGIHHVRGAAIVHIDLEAGLGLGQQAGCPGVVQVDVCQQNDPHVIEGSAEGAKPVLKSGKCACPPRVHDREAFGSVEETGGGLADSAEIL